MPASHSCARAVKLVDWRSPPAGLRLAAGDLHLWLIPVDLSPGRMAALSELLAPDEQARAARFHFERDRTRFVAARGSLRAILARYCRFDPAALRFEYSAFGKPSLALAGGPLDPPSFNISHSGDWALLAVRQAGRVGADIEEIRPELAGETIAERFFSEREVAVLRALPPSEQASAFFRCWTRKEAFVKARGEGLSLPLDRFDVSLRRDDPPALLRTLDDPAEAALWTVAAPAVPQGYEAAAVVEGALDSTSSFIFLETS